MRLKLLLGLVLLLIVPTASALTKLQSLDGTADFNGVGIRQAAAQYYAGGSNLTYNGSTTDSITILSAYLGRVGTPSGQVYAQIWTVGTTGYPNQLIAQSTNSIDAGTIQLLSGTTAGWYNFTFTAFNLTAGGKWTYTYNATYATSGSHYIRSPVDPWTNGWTVKGTSALVWTTDSVGYVPLFQLWGEPYTPPTNSCSYTSGNWVIQESDNCNITTTVNLGGNNLTLNGSQTAGSRLNITSGRIKGYTKCTVTGNFTVWGTLG